MIAASHRPGAERWRTKLEDSVRIRIQHLSATGQRQTVRSVPVDCPFTVHFLARLLICHAIVTRQLCVRRAQHETVTQRPQQRDRHDRVWVSLGVYAVALLFASIIPIPGGSAGGGGTGVWLETLAGYGLGGTAPFHVAGYAVLSVLIARVTERNPLGLLLAAGVATAFGFGIELLQSMIPWRSFSWLDVALNGSGAVGGVSLVAVSRASRRDADH